MTIDEVASKLSVDKRTVREWIRTGELRAVIVSRKRNSQKPRMRIFDDDLEKFLQARAVYVAPPVQRRRLLPPVKKCV